MIKRISLRTTKEIPASSLVPTGVVTCGDGGFLVQYKNSCWVSRYNANIDLLWRKEIGIISERYAGFELSMSQDGRLIGMHAKNFVHILDGSGNLLYKQEHEPWQFHQSSDCYFAPMDGVGKRHIWFFVPEKGGGGYLQVLDGADFSLVDSLWQEDINYYYMFYPTPDPLKVFINLAAGQDGSRLLEAEIIQQRIVLKEHYQCEHRALGSFSPTGKEIVLAPQFEEEIEIFSFPEMERIAELDQENLFEGRDEFPGENVDRVDYMVYFLSATTLMAKTVFGRLLLINRSSLECTGELLLEGCNINAFDHRGQQPVSDPTIIFDYASEIFDLKLTEKRQLVVIHVSNAIKVYDLPDEL